MCPDIQNGISDSHASVSVPLHFLISTEWVFLHTENIQKKICTHNVVKLKKKNPNLEKITIYLCCMLLKDVNLPLLAL